MITSHYVVKNEAGFIRASLASVAPFVERVIVHDTGSTDDTREQVKALQKKLTHIELYESSEDVSVVRQKQVEMTKTPFFLVVDGDEVYTEEGIKRIVQRTTDFPNSCDFMRVMTHWFIDDQMHVISRGGWKDMGRLFRTKGCCVLGKWPFEMHGYGHDERSFLDEKIFLYHYSMVPRERSWRKEAIEKDISEGKCTIIDFNGPQPEVFNLLWGFNPGRSSKDLGSCLGKSFIGCNIVVELGAMFCEKIRWVDARTRVGVEVHRPYLEKRLHVARRDILVINANATKLPELFIDKSIDGILMVDFIEHLPKDEAYTLLQQCEKVARKEIVIWVPEGSHPQIDDPYNMGAEHWQTHKSTWDHKEFIELRYDVAVWKDYHKKPYGLRNAMYCIKQLVPVPEMPEGRQL